MKSGSIKYEFICIVSLLIALMSCAKESEMELFNYLDLIPSHFPIPIIHPDSFPSEEKIDLGLDSGHRIMHPPRVLCTS